jgi:hypothetical protein
LIWNQVFYEYKFAYDSWAGQENLTPGDPCTMTTDIFTNRVITVTEATTLDEVCWGSCESCETAVFDDLEFYTGVVEPTSVPVTFIVDMNEVAEAFTTPEVNGTFRKFRYYRFAPRLSFFANSKLYI